MDRTKQTIEDFVKGTDFLPKLRAVLENIEQGKGFSVFEGLQKKGTCTIAINFDGADSLSLSAVDLAVVRPEVRAKLEAPKTQVKSEKGEKGGKK